MQLHVGDILACYGRDRVSRGIRRWTYRPWYADRRLRRAPSHVAIAAQLQPPGSAAKRVVWVESTSLCRRSCVMSGHPVCGVQAHDPDKRIIDYVDAGGAVHVYRLTPGCELEVSESFKLSQICEHLLKNRIGYDTLGAGVSGLAITRRWLNRVADLDSLFCSELVARVLQAINRMNWANPSNYTPGDLLRELVCSGVYAHHRSLEALT
jgi:hypothetical protein